MLGKIGDKIITVWQRTASTWGKITKKLLYTHIIWKINKCINNSIMDRTNYASLFRNSYIRFWVNIGLYP